MINEFSNPRCVLVPFELSFDFGLNFFFGLEAGTLKAGWSWEPSTWLIQLLHTTDSSQNKTIEDINVTF
jgi:hypothetical protein